MRRYLIPFVFGFATASSLFLFGVMPRHSREKYDYGRMQGEVLTKLDLLNQIPKALGDDYISSDGYKTFFVVKDGAAVVVERNGVKTLRMFVPGR